MSADENDKAFEQKLRRALEIDVPDLVMPQLPPIEADKVVTLPGRRVTAPAWFAIAATVVLAAFVGFRFMGGKDAAFASLADEVLAHVTHEPSALLVTDKAVSGSHLRNVVPASIANMNQGSSLITFAATCPINGNEVPHLVIQGQRGPITILLMPNEHVDAPITLNNAESHGVILPVGDGSIAIVGARDEQLEEVQQQVLQSVAWRT